LSQYVYHIANLTGYCVIINYTLYILSIHVGVIDRLCTTQTRLDGFVWCLLADTTVRRKTCRTIILIPIQPVFAVSPYCCMLRGEANKYQFHSLWFDPSGLKKIQLSVLAWYKADLIIVSLKINLFSP
jgi:hypothetical protein